MRPEISRRGTLQAAAGLSLSGLLPLPLPNGVAAAQSTAGAGPEELAHYYRFLEIAEGRRLVRDRGSWQLTGPPLTLHTAGVLPLVDNPDTEKLPPGSRQRQASEACDAAYDEVLQALQRVFDGHPDELREAVARMRAFEGHAEELSQIPSAPGASTVLGPAFRLPRTAGPRTEPPEAGPPSTA
ncbi:hypothetical protein ABZ934_31270 [Streptomyces sp. NPDC046557]|uniref:hypothetical protein n=1 Tax=Streptomyces sp. NPDC046557 TaxID=3155372 RepID=UPI0033E3E68E